MKFDAMKLRGDSEWLSRVRYSERVVCPRGHRPNKLRGGYRGDGEALVERAMFGLLKLDAGLVLSGMALGWDQALCVAAKRLKLPYVAVVRVVGQERMWPAESQRHPTELCRGALSVVVLSDSVDSADEAGQRLNARNEFMVRHSSAVLALYSGSAGGTGNAVRCATRFRVRTLNVWDAAFAA